VSRLMGMVLELPSLDSDCASTVDLLPGLSVHPPVFAPFFDSQPTCFDIPWSANDGEQHGRTMLVPLPVMAALCGQASPRRFVEHRDRKQPQTGPNNAEIGHSTLGPFADASPMDVASVALVLTR